MPQDQHFQVDLRGIIDLLSDHLYSGPEVYLRELLQNSVDALTAREKQDAGFISEESAIQIEVVQPTTPSEPPTLVITDHGRQNEICLAKISLASLESDCFQGSLSLKKSW